MHGNVGLVAPIRDYIDALMHPSARPDALFRDPLAERLTATGVGVGRRVDQVGHLIAGDGADEDHDLRGGEPPSGALGRDVRAGTARLCQLNLSQPGLRLVPERANSGPGGGTAGDRALEGLE